MKAWFLLLCIFNAGLDCSSFLNDGMLGRSHYPKDCKEYIACTKGIMAACGSDCAKGLGVTWAEIKDCKFHDFVYGKPATGDGWLGMDLNGDGTLSYGEWKKTSIC